jgi:hypothetical protein
MSRTAIAFRRREAASVASAVSKGRQPPRPLVVLIDADQLVVLSLGALQRRQGLKESGKELAPNGVNYTGADQVVDEFVRLASAGALKFDAAIRPVRSDHFNYLLHHTVMEPRDVFLSSTARIDLARICGHLCPHFPAQSLPARTLCAILSVLEGCNPSEVDYNKLVKYVSHGLQVQLGREAAAVDLEVDLVLSAKGLNVSKMPEQTRHLNDILTIWTAFLDKRGQDRSALSISPRGLCSIVSNLRLFNLNQRVPSSFLKSCLRYLPPHPAPPPPGRGTDAFIGDNICRDDDVVLAISGLESTSLPASQDADSEILRFVRKLISGVEALPSKASESQVFRGLHGLKNMDLKRPEVQHIVRFLSRLLRQCDHSASDSGSGASDEEIVRGFYGMRHFESRDICVLDLIDEVSTTLERRLFKPASRGQGIPPDQLSLLLFSFSGKASTADEVKRLVKVASSWIRTRHNSEVSLSSSQIPQYFEKYKAMCVGLYGLHNLDNSTEEVQDLLCTILDAFLLHYSVAISSERCVVTPQDISLALFGFRSMRAQSDVVRKILGVAVLPLLQTGQIDSNMLFSAQDITMCLSGMRYLNCNHKEVQEIIEFLTHQIRLSKATLNEREVSMCVNAMQNMSSKDPVACKLAEALIDRFPNHHTAVLSSHSLHNLNSQSIAMAIYGLRFMSSDYPQVRALVARVADLIRGAYDRSMRVVQFHKNFKSNDLALTDQGVVMCLHSLRYLSSQHCEVRSLLAALTPLVENSKYALTPADILNCLRGLKRMQSSAPEVKSLLMVLRNKISRIRDDSARLWYDEIFRTDVYGSDKLLDDIRFYSMKSPDYREILQYLMKS